DFTNDAARLRAAAAKFKPGDSLYLIASNSIDSGIDPNLIGGDPTVTGRNISNVLDTQQTVEKEMQRIAIGERIRITRNALDQIARHSSSAPGRKSVVWLSEDFPLSIDAQMRYDYGPEVRPALRALSDANIALYPIDARGLVPTARTAAENTSGTTRPTV